MVDEEKLSEVLSDFARTLITPFPIQRILDHLVERIVEVLPITAAGFTLISPTQGPRLIAASNDMALRCEHLQTEFGEGPCLAAYESGEAVEAPDLDNDPRFSTFAPAAVSAGLAAVFALPLRHGDTRIGALDLYRSSPGDLDPHTMEVAQTLADVAAAYLLNAQNREEADRAAARLQHSVLHDPLTGLPNRTLMRERLAHAARRAERSHTYAAILFIDLDNFKSVNDTYGHHVGDEALVAVADRLSRLVRSGDTFARISGDEFVFLCEDVRTADAEALAIRIDKAFVEPFRLPSTELKITASVGLAFAGPGEDVSDDLLVNADIAMYQAKRSGGAGHHVFDLREALDIKDGNRLIADLRTAVAEGDLEVAYQPIVRCADREIIGVEALLRWTHVDRGPVAPSLMIALAERSTLIDDIGAWVLERSCRDYGRWVNDHPGVPLELAVNVSPRHLSRDLSSIFTVLDLTDMDPTALVLEVTENVFVEDGNRVTAALFELKERGVRVALDDFGTGYSSLGHLHRLPIDIVKIDRSFIGDLQSTTKDAAIVAAATDMTHAMNLVVVAEGVETQYQNETVHAIGCDFAQGYLYGRPMPASDIDTLLAGR